MGTEQEQEETQCGKSQEAQCRVSRHSEGRSMGMRGTLSHGNVRGGSARVLARP